MSKPTGKLAFAYQTIAALEAKVKALESPQLPQDVEEFIAEHLREDPVTIDQFIDVDDLRDWMSGHVRVPVEPTGEMVMAGENAWDHQLDVRLEAKMSGAEFATYPSEETHLLPARAAYKAMLNASKESS